MLFVFHGSDVTKIADQASALVLSLKKKKPDAQVYVFEGSAFSERDVDELIEAQGLFFEKHIVVFKQPFEVAENRDIILARLERFAKTQNIIVITENKLLAVHKKMFSKHAEKIEEHVSKPAGETAFNVFALSDALGERNKQKLWTGYMQALRNGIEPESIHGTLHWSVKSILTAVGSTSPEDAGQKPYSFNKGKQYAKNYSPQELVKLSRDLITLYHDARRGKHELKTALERWVLSI
jgi:DNA polymerase III delta subunit